MYIHRTSKLAALWLITALLAITATAQPQKPTPKPFDVAAIKPNKSGSNSASMGTSHGRLTATNVTVRDLILKAFQLKDFQLSGGSDWVNTEKYDVTAKTDDQSISDDNLWLSLQPLLIDRFHLTFHRGTKDAQIYSLVTTGNKPKLTPHNGAGQQGMKISMGAGKATMNATNTSMAKLASALAQFTDRIVIDNTHLNGGFDFKLEWAQDQPGESAIATVEGALGMTGPSIFTAVQEQLGLKLQSTKGPVENLMIDRLDRPSAN